MSNYKKIEQFIRFFEYKNKKKIIDALDNPFFNKKFNGEGKQKHDFDFLLFKDKKITKREIECINLIKQGHTSREIAQKFHRSQRTIEKHIENIKEKLDCKEKKDILSIFR